MTPYTTFDNNSYSISKSQFHTYGAISNLSFFLQATFMTTGLDCVISTS